MAHFVRYDKVKDIETGKLLPEIIAEVNTGGDAYVLPTATANTLGGIKVGANLNIDDNGVLSAEGGGGTAQPSDFGELSSYAAAPSKFPKGYPMAVPYVIVRSTADSSVFFAVRCSSDGASVPQLRGAYCNGNLPDLSNTTISPASYNQTIIGFKDIKDAIVSDDYTKKLLLSNGVAESEVSMAEPNADLLGFKPPSNYAGNSFVICQVDGTNWFFEDPEFDATYSQFTGRRCYIAAPSLDFSSKTISPPSSIQHGAGNPIYVSNLSWYERLHSKYVSSMTLITQPTANQVYEQQILGGTTAAIAKYTGKPRQLVVNTDDFTLRVMDGTTPGGHLIGGGAGGAVPDEALIARVAALEEADKTMATQIAAMKAILDEIIVDPRPPVTDLKMPSNYAGEPFLFVKQRNTCFIALDPVVSATDIKGRFIANNTSNVRDFSSYTAPSSVSSIESRNDYNSLMEEAECTTKATIDSMYELGYKKEPAIKLVRLPDAVTYPEFHPEEHPVVTLPEVLPDVPTPPETL